MTEKEKDGNGGDSQDEGTGGNPKDSVLRMKPMADADIIRLSMGSEKGSPREKDSSEASNEDNPDNKC